MSTARLFLIVCLLPALVGCRSTRHRFHFAPSPNEVLVQPDPGGPVIARALVSIQRGERRESDGVPEMVVGVRLENNSPAAIRLIEEDLLLVDSEVQAFGTARVLEGGGASIEPGGSQKYELRFPYPDGLKLSARNLSGLNLRLAIEHAGGAAKATATFERVFLEPESSTGSSVHFGFFMSG